MTAEVTLADYSRFLQRYRQQKADVVAEAEETFAARFHSFAADYRALKAEALERERLHAPRYNVFRVLGLAHYEVRTHSAFLAHLLTPNASHGQGHLFLRHFLDLCAGWFAGFPRPAGDVADGRWQILTEHHTAHGNLDIVIRSPDLGYLCVIENKVYAGEQNEQLWRYAEWMARQEQEYEDRVLLYLTPGGVEATTSGGAGYFRLSYREHIPIWLRATRADVVAPGVVAVLDQYAALCAAL